jgi:hypothetical protein
VKSPVVGPASVRDTKRLFIRLGNLFAGMMIAGGLARHFLFSSHPAGWETTVVMEIFLALLGLLLLYYGFKLLRQKRLIEDVPSSKVRSVAMGLAELKGAARQKDPLVAPLTGAVCVYYRYTIEELRSRSKDRSEWVLVDSGESAQPFYLEDDTGTILVDPVGADTMLRKDHEEIKRDGGWTSRKRRYREWRLVPGERVYVLGSVRKTRDTVKERRLLLAERLQQLKRDADRLKEFDADKDGQISATEWEAAVRKVQEEMLRQEIARPAEDKDDLVIGQGEAERTFVLADRGEESMTRNLSLRAFGSLAGGFLILSYIALALLAGAAIIPPSWRVPWDLLLSS